MAGRFDYVRYDDDAATAQKAFKQKFEELESMVSTAFTASAGRPSALILTKLEEAYMWVGKAIRDQQIARGGDKADQPHRSNE